MNTSLKMAFFYLKKESYQPKTICLLTLFLITSWAYGQSGKEYFDIGKEYRAQIEKHLFPQIDTVMEKEVVLFIAIPSFNPEYSIRIVERENQSFIEGRSLEKNLWDELLEHRIKHFENSFLFNVNFFSRPISNNFKDSMQVAFMNVISNKKISDNMPIDGITFEFWIFDKRKRVRSVEVNTPMTGTIEYRMAILCTCIVNDLKNQSFEEVKYSTMLKSF